LLLRSPSAALLFVSFSFWELAGCNLPNDHRLLCLR
jgi:hypothetical protein